MELHAYRQSLLDEARRELHAAIPDAARDWCEPVELAVVGKPYEVVLRLADERRADLIVLGVHGRRTIEPHLFGSTADHLVREAPCPVLAIRP